MARKRSPTKRDAEPPRIDDLKLINGIGPEVEKRLNGRGIFTFDQIANLPPTDVAAAVAGLIGLSTEHIIKQDWIGQARKLAAEKTLSETQKNAKTAAESLAPIEHAHTTTPLVEPQQARKLISELNSKEVQEEGETSLNTAQVAKDIAPVEAQAPAFLESAPVDQTPSIELTHAVTPLDEPQKNIETIASHEQYRSARFTVELLLDENNSVHSARVMHIESQREHTWSGWPNTELVDFLSENVELKIPSDEPTPPIAEEHVHPEESVPAPVVVTESKQPLTPPAAEPRLKGPLHLREMEIIVIASNSPSKTLDRDTPFDVRLTLDLSELQVPRNCPLNYIASIYGKSSRTGLVLGQKQGTIIPHDTVTLNVEGNVLSEEGIYKLAAQVIIGLPNTKLSIRPETTALIDSGQIQVY